MAQFDAAAVLEHALTRIESIMESLLAALTAQRRAVAEADLPRLLAAVARQDEHVIDLTLAERSRLEAMKALGATDLSTALARLPTDGRARMLRTCERIAALVRQVDRERTANEQLICAALRAVRQSTGYLNLVIGPIAPSAGDRGGVAALVDRRI